MAMKHLGQLILALSLGVSAGTWASQDTGVDSLLAKVRASRSDAFLLLRGDEVLAEHYSGDPDAPIELMSVTKSVVSLGIGRLLALGRIDSLDTPVHAWFPEWKQGRKQQITLRHLLNHSSGLQNAANAGAEIYPAPDVVRLALAAELDSAPGERFAYNNKAVNLLAAIIQTTYGEPMDVFMRRELFEPMGIQPGQWHRDQAGNPHVMAGLPLTARDLARLGRLVLDDGRWQGRQLLPADYVHAMLEPGVEASCGLLWWRVPAFTRITLDADKLAALRDSPMPGGLIDTLAPLAGTRFDSQADYRQALGEALGENLPTWLTTLREHGLRAPVDVTYGDTVAYNGNGYLGQWLVIVPDADLVAVRQLRSREDFTESDGHMGFAEEVLAVARQLGGKP